MGAPIFRKISREKRPHRWAKMSQINQHWVKISRMRGTEWHLRCLDISCHKKEEIQQINWKISLSPKLCPICILAKVNQLNVFLKDKFLRTDEQHKKFSVLVLPFIIKTTRIDSYYKLTHQPFLPCRDAGASKNVNRQQRSPRY